MEVDVHEAKTRLVGNLGAKRELGWARGEFTVPDDFDDPLPAEIEDSFYN